MFRFSFLLSLVICLGLHSKLAAQEIKTFKTSDFSLRGNVKSCLVVTDYGKEEYYFNTTGQLTKSITRFNDFDYETTYYKYQNQELVEKRVENYVDKTFDKATSIANFYSVDTTAARIVTEKIVSYTKRLLEQNVYHYNLEGHLIKKTRTDSDGSNETMVVYDSLDGKIITTYILNEMPLKVIETWDTETEEGVIILQKQIINYLDGKLNIKVVEINDSDQRLISRADSLYDVSTDKWIAQEKIDFTYDDNGILEKTETMRQNLVSTKEYIYQFDGTVNHNWVKQIITPDNTYKTRHIKYYDTPILEEN